MIKFATLFSNNGFLGIPLVSAVFGKDSNIFIYLVVLNIITNALIYSLGVFLVSGDKKTMSIKSVLFNPVMVAFVIGIVFNLLQLGDRVGEIVTYSNYLSNIVTPISMIILGAKLGNIKMKKLFLTTRLYIVSAVKLILIPTIAVAVSILCRFGVEIMIAFFIAFAMPTAGLAPTIADKYNGDTENAAIFTLGTTLLSIITIPLLYYLMLLII